MKHSRKGMVLGLALAMWFACASWAQVLQQVPGDALVVLKIKDIKSTSDKLAKLANDLGVAAMAPQLADPLGFVQQQTHMQAGLNTAGEVAFVYVDPATVGGDPEKAMLILIPVSDYKAFLGNFPDAKTEGEVSEVKLGEAPEPGYLAQWGSYAALSPKQDIVAKKPTSAVKPPALTANELDSKDAVLYANFTALRTKLLPSLQQGREKVLAQVEEGMKREPAATKYAPVVKVLVGQFINAAEEFLKDANAVSLGINLVPEGINTTVLAEFEPGTYITQNVTAMKNTDAPLLDGLPTGKYLVYGGMANDPAMASKLFSDMFDPVVKELLAVGPEMKPVQQYVDAAKAYMAVNKGQTFGVFAPSGAVGVEPLLQFVTISSGDPKAMQTSYKEMMTAVEDAMKAFGAGSAASATYTPSAKTVDGVSFDQFQNKVNMNAQDPVALQQAQVMNMIYGPQGQVIYTGIVDDKLLTISGLNDQAMSQAIAAAKSNEAPLAQSDKVKAVSAQLPKQRIAVVYVPVDELVTTSLSYAKQFGFNVPVQLPPDLPPIGATVATDTNALRLDSHVPTQLVQSLVAAGMQAAMQMQGGGGPRGGGL